MNLEEKLLKKSIKILEKVKRNRKLKIIRILMGKERVKIKNLLMRILGKKDLTSLLKKRIDIDNYQN